MGKVISSGDSGHGVTFAKGGTTKMFGKGGAGPAPEGVSARPAQTGVGEKFASGGKGKMFGKGHAGAMPAGVSAKPSQ